MTDVQVRPPGQPLLHIMHNRVLQPPASGSEGGQKGARRGSEGVRRESEGGQKGVRRGPEGVRRESEGGQKGARRGPEGVRRESEGGQKGVRRVLRPDGKQKLTALWQRQACHGVCTWSGISSTVCGFGAVDMCSVSRGYAPPGLLTGTQACSAEAFARLA